MQTPLYTILQNVESPQLDDIAILLCYSLALLPPKYI